MIESVNYISHHRNVYFKMSEDNRLSPYHLSIYNALFMLWNECGYANELSINRNDVMMLSKIGNANTYTKCLKDLNDYGYIIYKPSFNPLIGSKITIIRFDKGSDKGSNKGSDKGSVKGGSKAVDKGNDTLYKHINLETKKTLKQLNLYDSEIETLLFVFNETFKTNYTSIDSLKTNYSHWRKIYEPAQMEQAIINVSKDQFWKNKMTPTILFRQKNSNKESVDYIGQFLNLKKESTPLDQMHDVFKSATIKMREQAAEKWGVNQ